MSKLKNTLKKADEIIVNTVKYISYTSGVCMVGIMFVAFFNVIGEKLRQLGLPVTGIPASTEIIQYLHIPVVFLATAYITFDRGHTRIDLLSSKFPKPLQVIFGVIGCLLGSAICGFISYRGFLLMQTFITRNKMSGVGGTVFPLWPFALILCIGFAMLSFTFLWAIVRDGFLREESFGGEE